ncbi:MAG: hypothetical protein NTV51_12855 [Verrucomicrobia bacterium]|nr:hypothetical protein [Verrucomicrobiota bacterium]
MHDSSPSLSDKLVPLPTAASLFGYQDAHYFGREVAGSKGIVPLRQGKRWFVWQSEVDRALASLHARSSAKPASSLETK